MITNFYGHIFKKNAKVAAALLSGQRVPLESQDEKYKGISMSILLENEWGRNEDAPQFKFWRGEEDLGSCDMEGGGCICWPGDESPEADEFGLMTFCTDELERLLATRAFGELRYNLDSIARIFSQLLLDTIGSVNLAQAVSRNMNDRGKGICHSHDFCDANLLMAEAFREVMKRAANPNRPDDLELWNVAWNVAKVNNFDASRI